MALGQPSKNPLIDRKADMRPLNEADKLDLRRKDIKALERAKEIEGMQTGCVTVTLGRGTLTAKPETIRHILALRGYRESEIAKIMGTITDES